MTGSVKQSNVLFAALFWSVVLCTVIFFGWMFISVSISRFYHPMSSLGHVGTAWFGTFAALALATVITAVVWVWRGSRHDCRHRYLIGALAVAATVGAHIASLFVETGYRQTYWVADTRHEIPWQYSPYNGSREPGGLFFLVRVAPEDFAPRYDTAGAHAVILMKATDYDYGKSSEAPEKICQTVEHQNMRCAMRRGRFVYSISGKEEHIQTDIVRSLGRAQILLDGFEVEP